MNPLRRLDCVILTLAALLGLPASALPALATTGDKALIVAQDAPSKTADPKKTETKKAEAKKTDTKKTADKKTKDAEVKEAKGPKEPKEGKSAADKSSESKKLGKPIQLASFGDWGAFLAQGGKEKTCYALAMPKERAPSELKRDQAYVFISSRPAENVRNEVSIIMGFNMKDGGDARAEIAGSNFDLIAKGANAWVKNPAQEPQFIDAMKHGAKLVVRAPSVKGNVTTDSYSLAGLSQALERVQKECP